MEWWILGGWFMNYFAMSNSTANSKGWTYSPTFYPIDGLVDYVCSTCGAMARYPIGRFALDLEGGSKYPDILMCGAWPILIVSGRVIQGWEEVGVIGYKKYPVEIRNISSKKLKSADSIEYFSIEVQARCELDLVAMGLSIVNECGECGKTKLSKPSWDIDRLVIKPESIGSADIFISSVFPSKVLVNEKIVDCACVNKHTNFEFVKSEESLGMFREPIDYLKRCR